MNIVKNYYNCIYMYKNVVNGKAYIGKAKDLKERHKQHMSAAYNPKAKSYGYAFKCAIRKYGIDSFELVILAHDLETDEEMSKQEKFFIEKYKTLTNVIGNHGYNIALGGEGGDTYSCQTDERKKEILEKRAKTMDEKTEEEKEWEKQQKSIRAKRMYEERDEEVEQTRCEKISEAWSKKTFEEKQQFTKAMQDSSRKAYDSLTDEEKAERKQRQKQGMMKRTEEAQKEKTYTERGQQQVGEANPFYGKHHTEETKRKHSERMKGRYAGANNPTARKVVQMTLDGEVIKIWDTIKEAKESLGGIGTIGRCCQGKCKTAGGYKWKYYTEEEV